jgi:hypothetical protein
VLSSKRGSVMALGVVVFSSVFSLSSSAVI